MKKADKKIRRKILFKSERKREPTSYVNFLKEKIKELKSKEEYKDFDAKMLSKIVSDSWKEMNEK